MKTKEKINDKIHIEISVSYQGRLAMVEVYEHDELVKYSVKQADSHEELIEFINDAKAKAYELATF